jgi:hypothetical protein
MIPSQIVSKFGFRRIRHLLDQSAHMLQALFVDDGRNPAPMRSGLQTSGCPMEREIVAHGAYGHNEPFGDLS